MVHAIQNDAAAFEHAGEELKKDRDFVWFALQEGDYASFRGSSAQFKHAAKEIKNNRDFVLSVLRNYGEFELLGYASLALRRDPTFMNLALRCLESSWRKEAFEFAADALRQQWSLKQIMMHHRIPVVVQDRVVKRLRNFLQLDQRIVDVDLANAPISP